MPLALTMAIAPVLAALGTLTMGCTHQTIHVELHQPLRDETNHLTQQILIGPLLKQLRQCHPFIGHRFPLRFVEASQLQPYRKNRWPPQGGRPTSNFYTTPRDTTLVDRYCRDVLPRKPRSEKDQRRQLMWWSNRLGSYALADVTSPLLAGVRDELSTQTERARAARP